MYLKCLDKLQESVFPQESKEIASDQYTFKNTSPVRAQQTVCLILLHIYLWRRLITLVYSCAIENLEILYRLICDACP